MEKIDLMLTSKAESSSNGMNAESERRCNELEMDAKLWSTLDDHLQEKIIARLPFRCLFHLAPSLSKTWGVRFGSPSFRREIETSAAVSWQSFGPLLVKYILNGSVENRVEIFGYGSKSQLWERLPAFDLPQHNCRMRLRAGNGSLFCFIGETRNGLPRNVLPWGSRPPVLVVNPLTNNWRELPPRPRFALDRITHLVLDEDKAYKVILGSMGGLCLCVQIYDSTDGAWIMESYYPEGTVAENGIESSVVSDGVLYILVRSGRTRDGTGLKMILMDVKERTFKERNLQLEVLGLDGEPELLNMDIFRNITRLVVCESNLMMVMSYTEQNFRDAYANRFGTLSIFKFALAHGLAIEVSRAPTGTLSFTEAAVHLTEATCHGDCIHIGGVSASFYYNVGTEQWDWLPSGPHFIRPFIRNNTCQWQWKSITYQPVSGPFLDV